MNQTWKYGDEIECDFSDSENKPVHQHKDGTWWYYDETGSHELGPFTSEADCSASFKLYAASL